MKKLKSIQTIRHKQKLLAHQVIHMLLLVTCYSFSYKVIVINGA